MSSMSFNPVMFHSLWNYRGFVFGAVKREFQTRYAGALLDAVWAVLNPLAMIVVFTLIFSQVMGSRLPDNQGGAFGYSVFLCSALLPWNMKRRLDAEAPTHFSAPSGSSVPIDYDNAEGPKLAIRVQEMFGLDRHPSIAGGKVPLVVELLSPAQRPVQVTRDLPGFWRGSYAAVKADMRGRYPRHPWPDDPLKAPATRRAKPRGT